MSFEYKTIAYQFGPGAKVEQVIREHNHPNMSNAVVEKLMAEFTKINKGELPPKMGSEVMIPVLLPFYKDVKNKQPRRIKADYTTRKP